MVTRAPGRRAILAPVTALIVLLLPAGCADTEVDQPVLTAGMPLHLEDHLDAAIINGSEVSDDLIQPVEWRFDEPQPDWKPIVPAEPSWEPVEPVRVDGVLRLPMTGRNRSADMAERLEGGIYVGLPDWRLEDWAYVEIRARTRDPMLHIGLSFNFIEEGEQPRDPWPFYTSGDRAFLVTDGTVQTYRLFLTAPTRQPTLDGLLTDLAVYCTSQDDQQDVALDILSVRVMPRETEYAGDRAGVLSERRGSAAGSAPYRRTLYTHAPGRVAYRVRVPEHGRFDVGFGVLRRDRPVTFTITAAPRGAEVETLLEETYADQDHWGQRSVDLSHLSGQEVTLALEAESERPGTVALWAAPTLTGPRISDKPNVIFYVIDGAGAEYMSVYGYNRRTTPNLERLAAEGAVFEWAYSNSGWTRPSTASFMTSLQSSVLQGLHGAYVVPDNAPTMAQHMHRAGYQTAVFTPNPNAGRISGLERGVDFHREDWDEFSYNTVDGTGRRESSRVMHDAFWRWRDAYPAEPYWVHFQPIDGHGDFPAPAPFSGLYVGPEQLRLWTESAERLGPSGVYSIYRHARTETDIDRVAFYTVMQGLYDEAMAHTDYQIGRLVERLRATGEWDNTLLIVGSDHSVKAAMVDMAIAIQDSLPPRWSYAAFRPSISRVPLIFVWPGHIEAGLRISEAVSMIDVLPTVLELVGLPPPEIAQGQSLAPLLLGDGTWESRPVILDQSRVDQRGDRHGGIDVVDGRWGASLGFNPSPLQPEEVRSPSPLLLYDLWNDPYCLHSLHEERPDLVEKYTAFLEAQFETHQALVSRLTPGDEVALTPEQLRALRALGYIQ